MGKTVSYKRKLRHTQKLKKKEKMKKKESTTFRSDEVGDLHSSICCQEGEGDRRETNLKNSEKSGSAPHDVVECWRPAGAERDSTHQDSTSTEIEPESNIKKEKDKLIRDLKIASKQIEYYCAKIEQQEKVIDVMEEACVRRIRCVRHFWRDQIYMEGSRPGKILKMAMQNSKKLHS